MKIDISDKHLPIYEALASNVRLKIIQLLSQQEMNIKDLAQSLELSSPIMTMHVKKLEKAGLISSEMVSSNGGTRKMCKLITDSIEIDFPSKNGQFNRLYHESIISIGHYTDFDIEPTCGLATTMKVIGMFDEPRFFLDAERINAKILWFGNGYIEYKIANFLLKSEKPAELEISLEISSEAPSANENWPSDISFYLNDCKIGTWTSPGDFGGKRGRFTPDWWWEEINQYGLLKMLKVTPYGTFIDGHKISDVTLDQVGVLNKQWKFRIGIEDDAENIGGVTLFGAGFGNYNQDIVFRLYYERYE
ncbi:ArsR family transcriptional regulator [Paenibacillus alkaliterrae]|uniref:ArsR/SmtB family transcription factor n=1 Tax=Paenibacillus alkaliterrae TaxID=320909 RepID=UPI001F3D1C88|nr:ArsR family transcriptional regulator [Paenibacillus alkaliterrae]MCF2939113.1 ArsR family transcriptional regulator [Paenibacillus alkaliterrae]